MTENPLAVAVILATPAVVTLVRVTSATPLAFVVAEAGNEPRVVTKSTGREAAGFPAVSNTIARTVVCETPSATIDVAPLTKLIELTTTADALTTTLPVPDTALSAVTFSVSVPVAAPVR